MFGIEETDGIYMFKRMLSRHGLRCLSMGQSQRQESPCRLSERAFSLPDDEWKTKEEKTDFQTVKLSAEFMEREQDNAYKVLADEDAPNFNLDKFYEKCLAMLIKSGLRL
ncbi:hypothetical protein PO124_31100 [Bacillus licheniformis]|nr:hypothetical protein [Bacillus licheniformis]